MAPPGAQVVVIAQKRGGSLAVKLLLICYVVYLVGAISLGGTFDRAEKLVWMTLPFGMGAAYLIFRLLMWKRNNNPVTGAAIGWIIAVLMITITVNGIAKMSGTSSSSSLSSASSSGTGAGSFEYSPPPDPKDIVMRRTKLDFTWSKDGFGSVMMASFIIQNPTRYRFKDVEIKCTHSAPSGTEIDSNTRTIYEMFEPRSTKQINKMNMGFIHSQATSSECRIKDLTIVP
jgi:hypothetical protein